MTLGVVATLVADGFELAALERLGLTLEAQPGSGLVIRWTSALVGSCAAPVASTEEARAWVRKNWRLFAAGEI